MSIEKALRKMKEIREAEGVIEGKRISITLSRAFLGFPFPIWDVRVHIHGGESDSRSFWRRKSADKHFDKLVDQLEN